jgi:hypothetical protein
MSTLAETAIVDYRCLSFADQGKQTSVSVLCFCLKQTSGSFPFPFCVCSKRTEVAIFSYFLFLFEEFLKHGDKETKRHGDGGMETWGHLHEAWKHGEMES